MTTVSARSSTVHLSVMTPFAESSERPPVLAAAPGRSLFSICLQPTDNWIGVTDYPSTRFRSRPVVKRPRFYSLPFAAYLSLSVLTGCMINSAEPVPAALQASTQVERTQHPLVARYRVTSPVTSTVFVEFGLDSTYGRRTWSQTATANKTLDILVAGMRPSQAYHMRAVVEASDGRRFLDADHVFETSAVPNPSAVPTVNITTTATAPTSGVEMLDFVRTNGQFMTSVFDLDGNLIWYYDYDQSLGIAYSFRPMPNGNMLILTGTKLVREVDLAGQVVAELSATDLNQKLTTANFPLQVTGFHHDALPLPNGHIAVICEEVRTVNVGGVPTAVRGDAIVDLDSALSPKWTWSTFDHLDVNRHPMDVIDWTHANALLYSPADGALLLSLRNQHWVLKIDYKNGSGTGALLWRLGTGGDFQLVNGTDSDWFFGQHFPHFAEGESGGNPFQLLVFDNRATNQAGSTCATTTGTCFSRALELKVDELAKTASIEWENRLPYYSLFGGNIQNFTNGNLEFALSNPFGTALGSLVMEVAPQTNQLIWQMEIQNQLAYRAFRIPSLYPGVQW